MTFDVFLVLIGALFGAVVLRTWQALAGYSRMHRARPGHPAGFPVTTGVGNPLYLLQIAQARAAMKDPLGKYFNSLGGTVGLQTIPARVADVKFPTSEVGATKATAADLEPFTEPLRAFRDAAGELLPPQKVWGAVPTAELAGMFLDQFLLRYWHEIMRLPDLKTISGGAWKAFVSTNPWAKDMPLLFWQLTSYKMSHRQLDAAIEDYVGRLGQLAATATGATILDKNA